MDQFKWTFGIVFFILFYLFFSRVAIFWAVGDGDSMEPTYHNASVVAMSKLPLWLFGPRKNDVVIFHEFNEVGKGDGKIDLKRIVGGPGDTLTYIIDYPHNIPVKIQTVTLKSDEYFVLGDNHDISYDSRFYGPIHRSQIIGVAWKSKFDK
jgi:signal peptidase I